MRNDLLMQTLNLKLINNELVGTVNNYNLSIIDVQNGYVKMPVAVFVFDRSISKDELTQIKKTAKSTYRLINFKQQNDVLTMFLPPKGFSNEKFVQKTEDMLNAVTNKFNELGFKQHTTCQLCDSIHEDEDPVLKLLGEYYIPIHQTCSQQLVQEVEVQAQEENAKKGNLPISIMFAIVGGVIGLVPTILSVIIAGMYYALLFALIPLGATLGYKLGGAPKKKYMTTIIIVVSFVVVLLFNLFFIVSYAQLEGIPFSTALSDGISDALITFLFTGIGVLISWKYISNTTDKNIQNARKLNH